ncbi:hypothetical protein [Fibrobacter sp.]|uniref:hypothetical protein n=1 Tax=Fibrobacter sp. TaxID=35828 RepID=UPI0025C2D342|nr:hypothetical protein [Fibrobacter sp.]MBR3072902.1 hypothetical protein [Fibrobacter sp.]
MKLQDAYVAEKGTVVGSMKAIGYSIPTSTVFTYAGFTSGDDVAISSGKTEAWKATAGATLNDCVSGVWQLDIAQNTSTGGSITYTPKVSSISNCQKPLTPNFCNIGGSGTCTAIGG